MSKVLVTGAGGYVGSGLVGALEAQGWDVRAAVREPVAHLHAEQAVGDIAHEHGAADRAVDGVDTVVHLAGDNEVVAARDPAFALSSTISASELLAGAAARPGCGASCTCRRCTCTAPGCARTPCSPRT